MTPAGVGKFLPGDSQTALICTFNRTNFQDLLANQAQDAEEKLPQHLSRPDFFGWIFQVAPFRKSTIYVQTENPTNAICGQTLRENFK